MAHPMKTFSSVYCKVSESTKTKYGNLENDVNKVDKTFASNKYLQKIVLTRLQSMILGIDNLKEDKNFEDNIFEPYSELLSKISYRYPLEIDDKKKINELIIEMSSSDLEREDYISKCFRVLKILGGYLNSEDYKNETKKFEKYLYEKYFTLDLYPPLNQFKENLVLDLDETLIHSESPIDNNKTYNYVLTDQNIGVYVRNYLKEFLEEISNDYNLILFSAGTSFYANSVIEIVGIKDYFSIVLTRESCCNPYDDIFIKDLSVLSTFLNNKIKEENNINTFYQKEIIIVDNNLLSFAHDLNNGIVINDFKGTQDKELIDLYSVLMKLKNAKEDSNVSFEFLLHKINNFIPKLKESIEI